MARTTESERRFLVGLVMGEVRQGALEGVVLEAVAKAAKVSSASLQRAAMLAGDLGAVARAALTEGESALAQYRAELFRPISPMLADSAETVAEAIERLGAASFEYKFDGARIQVHKRDTEIRIYTRNLNDVTVAVPEVVEVAAALPCRVAILDGEAIALSETGRPHPFQITMRRFGRKLDVSALRPELPLTPFFFDVLLIDGEELLDRSQADRFARLAALVSTPHLVPRLVTADPAIASEFLERALQAGHEGLMAKGLEARYEAGRRGSAWLKIKLAKTLDLVVLAAEWGHGRRKGWLSNIHLGARDPGGGFVMLGKTFKGMTDEMLAWQTKALLELEQSRDGHTVHVRPELVVEVAFDGIQESRQYPGGVALRFARVKGYRPDKEAASADTIETVRAIHGR
jgi:DNA ligase-1